MLLLVREADYIHTHRRYARALDSRVVQGPTQFSLPYPADGFLGLTALIDEKS